MTMNAQITGLKDLSAVMKKLPLKVTNKHARRGLRQGAAKIRDDIKRTAPMRPSTPDGKRRRPGGLRRNVFVKGRRSKRGLVKAGVFMRTQGEPDGPKNASYWRFVEYGFRHKFGKHVPAQPFVAVTARRNFKNVVRIVLREIDEGIRDELTAGPKSALGRSLR